MAMKDLKSIQVAPEEEEKTVQLWMSFGWELKNNQRVKTQDVQVFTGQDKDGTKHYQTTRGEDFVKLTFERDPERKNYAELKALEEQYYTPLPSVPPAVTFPDSEPKRVGALWIVLMVLTCWLLIPPVLILVLRLATYKSRVEKWEQKKAVFDKNQAEANVARSEALKALSEAKKKRADALEKAKSLV